jgi:hypothetical protein
MRRRFTQAIAAIAAIALLATTATVTASVRHSTARSYNVGVV